MHYVQATYAHMLCAYALRAMPHMPLACSPKACVGTHYRPLAYRPMCLYLTYGQLMAHYAIRVFIGPHLRWAINPLHMCGYTATLVRGFRTYVWTYTPYTCWHMWCAYIGKAYCGPCISYTAYVATYVALRIFLTYVMLCAMHTYGVICLHRQACCGICLSLATYGGF